MKGKIKSNKNKVNKINKGKKYKKIKRKKILIKESLHPKIEFLMDKIKKYQEPNEYTRQDQDQKLMKYMRIPPVEYIKK